jgi:biotin carboxyl carrier protein
MLVNERPVPVEADWSLAWTDETTGTGLLRRGAEREPVVVERLPSGGWAVTLRGRRIEVRVETHRERLLASSSAATARRHGPVEVRASLPGLVVRIAAVAGTAVNEGDPLLTLEAMKMQNEVRAPRAGRIASIEVSVGQAVAAGAVLVRLADPEP